MADAGRWAVLRRIDLPAAEAAVSPGLPADDTAKQEARKKAIGSAPQSRGAAALRRPIADPELLEHIANVLLRRYGVVCWQLLNREASRLPPWRDLLRVLHRMEARGHVRGGRFVTGLSGEQFALPEAVALLRDVRRRGTGDGALVCVSAADPLNLVGTVLPGEKVPAVAGNRIVFRDGVPAATLIAGRSNFLGVFDETTRVALHARLMRPDFAGHDADSPVTGGRVTGFG